MSRKITFTEEQIELMKECYFSGKTLEEVGIQFGCSWQIARKRLIENGVTLRGTWSNPVRRCRGKCGQVLPVGEFYGKKNYICRKCTPDYQREKGQTYKKFGISVADYDALMAKQSQKCAICGRDQSEFSKRFAVDHDHTSGKVRGLLCANCNTAIGHLEDNVDWMRRAIDYLTK